MQLRSILLATVLITLGACGGGGSGNTTTPPPPVVAPVIPLSAAPVVTASVGLKQIKLVWTAVNGATVYKVFQNADGASGFVQVGSDFASTAINANVDIAVHRFKWTAAQFQVDACNSAGCTHSNIVNAPNTPLQAIGYFKASNTDANDGLGTSVSVSADGNTLALGAYGEASTASGIGGDQSINTAVGAGAVYIYSRSNGVWSATPVYLKAPKPHAGDLFGYRVLLSPDGNTLAVGAPTEASSATGVNGNQNDTSAAKAGAVFVYTRTNGVWSATPNYIKASNTKAQSFFGYALGLSTDGNVLAVSAFRDSSNARGVNGSQSDTSAALAGAVYIYTRTSGAWSNIPTYIKASNTDAGDEFGTKIVLSGDGGTLIVGVPNEASNAKGMNGSQTDNSAALAGAAYIYTIANGVWSNTPIYLKAPNAEAGDQYGSALALSADGNTLAIGALSEASNATGIGGTQTNNSTMDAGAVYIYTRSAGVWQPTPVYVKASNTANTQYFGAALALSSDGNILAVGAYGESSGAVGIGGNQSDGSVTAAGAVYVYTRSTNTWLGTPTYVKALNPDVVDNFGIELSMSTDGNTLAVGANRESSNATNIGGNGANNSATNSGAVYLY